MCRGTHFGNGTVSSFLHSRCRGDDYRLAGDLEVGVRHGDRRFLVHASEKFRFFVGTVGQQRLVQSRENCQQVNCLWMGSDLDLKITSRSESFRIAQLGQISAWAN